jgi:hypothetical protein
VQCGDIARFIQIDQGGSIDHRHELELINPYEVGVVIPWVSNRGDSLIPLPLPQQEWAAGHDLLWIGPRRLVSGAPRRLDRLARNWIEDVLRDEVQKERSG